VPTGWRGRHLAAGDRTHRGRVRHECARTRGQRAGAALAGEPDIAVGNVVGSNIFNVLFILGISALVAPLVVQRQLVRIDVPIMLGASVLLLLLARDGSIGRGEGGVLIGLLAAYIALLIRLGRDATAADRAAAATGGRLDVGRSVPAARAPSAPTRRTALLAAAGLAFIGLLLLVGGSNLFVRGAVALATLLGVSQVVIGLTIIAAGTSLPEVATSLLASLRGERDIAVGNVVGSNVFNILGILGACGVVGAEGLAVAASVRAFDLPIMVAVALLACRSCSPGSASTGWRVCYSWGTTRRTRYT
jgi:cation:H+ antiporter